MTTTTTATATTTTTTTTTTSTTTTTTTVTTTTVSACTAAPTRVLSNRALRWFFFQKNVCLNFGLATYIANNSVYIDDEFHAVRSCFRSTALRD